MGNLSNLKSFIQRLRFKYKLAILNENTLEEIWRIRLSKLSVIAVGFMVAVLYFFLIAFLIINTPMRGFLPGYTENVNLRKQLTLNSLVVDSISEQVSLQTKYVAALRSIVAGEIPVDSVVSADSLRIVAKSQLSGPSERELAFRDSFEAEEIVSTAIGMHTRQESINHLMQQPAKGRVLESYNPHLKIYGVTMMAEHNSNVVSILDGVVISCEYSLNNIYIMTIQHPDNIISVYKTRQPYMQTVGEKVHAGQALTTFHSNDDCYFEFQLWKDGMSMDPQVFIMF